MTRFAYAAALLAAWLSVSAPAQVATDEASDIDCLAATLIISQNSDAMNAQQAMSAVMYFTGKITARQIDYTARLETAMRDMTNVDLQRIAQRCGAELQFVGEDMQRRGAEIEARSGAETGEEEEAE